MGRAALGGGRAASTGPPGLACYPEELMADHKEIRVERLYVKVPNTDKLRKNAAGRHRHLLAAGWREMERKQQIDHIWVRYERTGPTPLRLRMPRPDKDQGRFERRPRGGDRGGFRGGPRGGGRGRR
jgi:hypothetical protein